MPKKFRISIPILIVPLATVGGKPKKIKVGSVINEPPAETRLINPTKTPNNNNVIKTNNVTLKHPIRSEEHTSELQSRFDLVCRLVLEKKKKNGTFTTIPKVALETTSTASAA